MGETQDSYPVPKGQLVAVQGDCPVRLAPPGHCPASEPFRKWVTEEVLPTIRKTGKYNAEESSDPIALGTSLTTLKTSQARELRVINSVTLETFRDISAGYLCGCRTASARAKQGTRWDLTLLRERRRVLEKPQNALKPRYTWSEGCCR